MQKDTYTTLLQDYDVRIDNLKIQRNRLVSLFKKECRHPTDDISIKTTVPRDEYDRYMPEWTEYEYFCHHCLERLTTQKKIGTVDEMRILMNKQIEEKY